jgi:hypothetical protein
MDTFNIARLLEAVTTAAPKEGPEVDEYGDTVNTTVCLFKGTTQTYMDCCTESAIKTCNFLQIMFWACFVLYAATFYYIVQKKPWIKHHGLYINVFAF